MKVLVVRSPTLINNFTTAVSPALPIGLAYIVGAIKDLVDVEVIDPVSEKPLISDVTPFTNGTSIMGLTPQETIEKIKCKPDVFMLSTMFSLEWPVARCLINLIKETFPKCIIIGGGEHITALPEFSLKASNLDICVLGEGEVTARELIQRILDDYKIPLDVPGTFVKHPTTKSIINNDKRKRVKQVDEFKYPAWEYFNVQGFLDRGAGQMGSGSGKEGLRALPFIASRGCPYECTFCSNPSMWGKLWKVRTSQDVLNEWKFYIEKYQVNHFDSADLTAIVKKSWIVEFCKLLIKENLKVTWGLPTGTRSEALDYEVLDLLKKSGCNDIDYAPESGSDFILKVIKKKINKKNMLKSMKFCYQLGINSKANIILGFNEEKRLHVLETYVFITKMAFSGINDVIVTNLTPYPGSAIFDRLMGENKITLDDDYFFSLSAQGSLDIMPCYSKYYSKTELYLFKMGGFILFYLSSFLLRPHRLWILIRDLIKGEGTTRLSMGLISIFKRWKNRISINSRTSHKLLQS